MRRLSSDSAPSAQVCHTLFSMTGFNKEEQLCLLSLSVYFLTVVYHQVSLSTFIDALLNWLVSQFIFHHFKWLQG